MRDEREREARGSPRFISGSAAAKVASRRQCAPQAPFAGARAAATRRESARARVGLHGLERRGVERVAWPSWEYGETAA